MALSILFALVSSDAYDAVSILGQDACTTPVQFGSSHRGIVIVGVINNRGEGTYHYIVQSTEVAY